MFARVTNPSEEGQVAGTWDEESEASSWQPLWAQRHGCGVRRATLVGGGLLAAGMCVTAFAALAGGSPLEPVSGRGAGGGGVEVAQLDEEKGEPDAEIPSDKLQFLVDTVKELKSETDEIKKQLRKIRIGFLQCGDVTCHGSEKCCGDSICCGPEATCCGELCCGHNDVCCTSELGSSICGAHGADCKDGFVFAPGTVLLKTNSSSLPGLPELGELPMMLPVSQPALLQRSATGKGPVDIPAAEASASEAPAMPALAAGGVAAAPAGSVAAAVAAPTWMLVPQGAAPAQQQPTQQQQQQQAVEAMPRGNLNISPEVMMLPYAAAMPTLPASPPASTEANLNPLAGAPAAAPLPAVMAVPAVPQPAASLGLLPRHG